ncbi:MAG: hypothetical protein RR250_06595 [Akkermansia sp.]
MNHDALDALLVIQERDKHIAKLSRELLKLPELRAQIVQRLQTSKQRTLKAKQKVQETESEIRNAEAGVEQKHQLISKLKIQQGDTRKNEEYQRYITEIGKAEKIIDDLETRQLELMESLETIKADCATQTAKLKGIEREVEEELARFDNCAQQDTERLKTMKSERVALAAAIDPDSLSIYDRMSLSKGLPVIVDMNEAGQCTGCFMVLTQATKLKVLAGRETVHCENCFRILH